MRVPDISSTSFNLSSKSQSPAQFQSEGNEAPPLGGRKSPDFTVIFHLGQSPSSRILQSTSLKKKNLSIDFRERGRGGGERKREIVCSPSGDQTHNLGTLGQCSNHLSYPARAQVFPCLELFQWHLGGVERCDFESSRERCDFESSSASL